MFEKDLLFRYRSVSEHSIKELIEESMVFSTADTFNDPTDIALSYDIIDYTEELTSLKIIGNSISSDYFDKSNSKNMATLFFDNRINKMIDDFKKNVVIGCFSRDFRNPVMLSHYAANRTGFVLGYTFEEIDKLVKNNPFFRGELLDVEYTGEKVSIRDEAIEIINSFTTFVDQSAVLSNMTIQNEFNSLLVKDDKYKKAFYTKSSEWEYEKEIRCIAYIENLNKSHIEIGKCKPRIIVLGDRLSLKDKYLLLSIAKEKDIMVLELMLSYRNDQFGLMPYPITKKMIDTFLKENNYGFVIHPSSIPSD